jgi:hypothetical protein
MAVIKTVVDALNRNSLVRRAKNGRNQIVDRIFRARGSREADRLVGSLTSSNVCFTIAFNVPWAVDLMATAWRSNATNLELVVVNNSSDAVRRDQIRSVCDLHRVLHVDLPHNPEWNPCRSHGIAMNWIFYNVVTRLRPSVFGFIDHDCFPVKAYNIADRLGGKDVYGVRVRSSKIPDAWTLWAGFCFFRYSSLEARNIDFKHRVEFGLDTGGGNWLPLYSSLDPGMVASASHRLLDENAKPTRNFANALIDGAFWHVGSLSFGRGSQQEVANRLAGYGLRYRRPSNVGCMLL